MGSDIIIDNDNRLFQANRKCRLLNLSGMPKSLLQEQPCELFLTDTVGFLISLVGHYLLGKLKAQILGMISFWLCNNKYFVEQVGRYHYQTKQTKT